MDVRTIQNVVIVLMVAMLGFVEFADAQHRVRGGLRQQGDFDWGKVGPGDGQPVNDGPFARRRQRPRNGNSQRRRDFRMGEPSYRGTGCPEGTASVALTDDKKTLSVLFDEYVVEAGENADVDPQNIRKGRTFKNCRVTIPLDVPAGFHVAVVQVDHRGFVSVPEGGKAAFASAVFFRSRNQNRRQARANGTFVRRRMVFDGPTDEDYILSSQLEQPMWSPCGQNVHLKINTRLWAQSNQSGDDVLATVDSVDVNANDSKTVYHLLWQRCEGPKPKPPGKPPVPPAPPKKNCPGVLKWNKQLKRCLPARPPVQPRPRTNPPKQNADTRPIFNLFNGKDYMDSHTTAEGARARYRYTGQSYQVYKSAAPGRRLLYRCHVGRNHFTSAQPNCEGQKKDGPIGYVYVNPTGEAKTALWRCFKPGKGHITSQDPGHCSRIGYHTKGKLGYVK